SHYKGCMDKADVAVVYYNPHAIAHKKLPPITDDMVFEGFGRADLQVYHDSAALTADLKSRAWQGTNLLWMTSGNFDGVDERALAREIAG
ncbi:MAG: peptidoglycan synthetase, partial [Bacteroidales bacterium]|nr:peptidoglycan synthetase [Bacteroidales bacterium]